MIVSLGIGIDEGGDLIVDAYIASIAIRIMSDTRDEEQEQRWRERQDRGVLQDTQDLTVTYNTGNILNSIIPVLYIYQCISLGIVTYMHT